MTLDCALDHDQLGPGWFRMVATELGYSYPAFYLLTRGLPSLTIRVGLCLRPVPALRGR
jgi:hypothetical protein